MPCAWSSSSTCAPRPAPKPAAPRKKADEAASLELAVDPRALVAQRAAESPGAAWRRCTAVPDAAQSGGAGTRRWRRRRPRRCAGGAGRAASRAAAAGRDGPRGRRARAGRLRRGAEELARRRRSTRGACSGGSASSSAALAVRVAEAEHAADARWRTRSWPSPSARARRREKHKAYARGARGRSRARRTCCARATRCSPPSRTRSARGSRRSTRALAKLEEELVAGADGQERLAAHRAVVDAERARRARRRSSSAPRPSCKTAQQREGGGTSRMA